MTLEQILRSAFAANTIWCNMIWTSLHILYIYMLKKIYPCHLFRLLKAVPSGRNIIWWMSKLSTTVILRSVCNGVRGGSFTFFFVRTVQFSTKSIYDMYVGRGNDKTKAGDRVCQAHIVLRTYTRRPMCAYYCSYEYTHSSTVMVQVTSCFRMKLQVHYDVISPTVGRLSAY